MTNLKSLNLSYNKQITNEGIKGLTNLEFLNLIGNNNITKKGTRQLPNLNNIKYGNDNFLNNPYYPILLDEGQNYISNNAREINSDLDSVYGFMYHGLNLMQNVLNRVKSENEYNKKRIEEIMEQFLEKNE